MLCIYSMHTRSVYYISCTCSTVHTYITYTYIQYSIPCMYILCMHTVHSINMYTKVYYIY